MSQNCNGLSTYRDSNVWRILAHKSNLCNNRVSKTNRGLSKSLRLKFVRGRKSPHWLRGVKGIRILRAKARFNSRSSNPMITSFKSQVVIKIILNNQLKLLKKIIS